MAENVNIEFPHENKQGAEERRQIRLKYRDFIDELQQNKEDLIKPESDQLHERLKEADELFKPVKTAREAVLDSQAMSLIANIGRMKAQALHTEFVRFQASEFAEKLITYVGGQGARTEGCRISSLGWTKLGCTTQPFFRRTPPFQYMLGSFERGPKPVKEAKQPRAGREKDNVGKETVPQQMKDFTEAERSETTTEEVERVYDILKRTYDAEEGNPLCYFEFVLNPQSFGQTVENIFYVSFLVRDGLAQVFLDSDDLPVIQPRNDPEPKKNSQRDQKRHQAIISITPTEWKELIKTFKIETATIPPRDTVQNGENSPPSGS